MSPSLPKFRGSLDQLRTVVARTELSGSWQRIPHGWCYRCDSGALLNWWPTRGTLSFQGQPDRADEFEAALLTAVSDQGSQRLLPPADDDEERG